MLVMRPIERLIHDPKVRRLARPIGLVLGLLLMATAVVFAISERAQSGAVSHRGRTPKRIEGQADRAAIRRQLIKEIEAAVAAEQYERAASLQGRLQQLGLGKQPPTEPTE